MSIVDRSGESGVQPIAIGGLALLLRHFFPHFCSM